MDRISTRRARGAGVGVMVGVSVSVTVAVAADVAVCEGVAEAVVVSVGGGVSAASPGRLGIWHARMRTTERTAIHFGFGRMNGFYPQTKVILRGVTRG